MQKLMLVPVGLVSLCVSGCQSEPEEEFPYARLDELSRNYEALNERVARLEQAARTPDEVAAEADSARLERLRAGQRLIQGNQKMLCDATQDC